MKTILFTLLILTNAQGFASERILLKDSKQITAHINIKTMRCSAVGYSGSELKINLSDLDGWTILDHSNARFGEFNGEPCMTAGRCKAPWNDAFDLDVILNNGPSTESAIVSRTIIETKEIDVNDQGTNICRRTITESLETNIRNIPFAHSRSISQDLNELACK